METCKEYSGTRSDVNKCYQNVEQQYIPMGQGIMEHGEIDELLANFRDPEQLITWASLWGIVDDPVIQLRLIELRCQQILDNETNTSIIDDHEANIQSGCGSDDQLPGPSRQIDDVFSTNPGLVGENSFYNIRKKGSVFLLQIMLEKSPLKYV
ncbi:hypothetical protein ScPMuIL_001799 [Solemya velum]